MVEHCTKCNISIQYKAKTLIFQRNEKHRNFIFVTRPRVRQKSSVNQMFAEDFCLSEFNLQIQLFGIVKSYFLFFKTFFFSLSKRRSTFFTSSAGGRFSGTIPLSINIWRTAALLSTCSFVNGSLAFQIFCLYIDAGHFGCKILCLDADCWKKVCQRTSLWHPKTFFHHIGTQAK